MSSVSSFRSGASLCCGDARNSGGAPVEFARRGGDILLFSGNELWRLLLDAGILYAMTSEQEAQVGLTCLAHLDHITDETSQLFDDFCRRLGITSDFVRPEPLCSLRMYRTYFADVVFAVRNHPGGDPGSRPWLCCACEPFSKYAMCEHVEYLPH